MNDSYFHIESIIELVKEHEPERNDIVDALKRCKKQKWIRQAYVGFVSSIMPNQTNSEWQFEESVVLEHSTEGTIVLDILKNGEIGGIEFVNQIR